jgi:sodium/hydrogen exchanger 8
MALVALALAGLAVARPERDGTMSEAEAALEEEEKEESMTKWSIVVGMLSLAATFAGGFLFETSFPPGHWLHGRVPEAAIGVTVGCFVAAGARVLGGTLMMDAERFDFEFFMTWLLPPIIFEAGFNMNVPIFMANLGPTMFFAFLGTFASTFVVGGIVYAAGQAGLCYPMSLLAALVFGSLISATDPVTVLAVFQALGVKKDVFSMVPRHVTRTLRRSHPCAVLRRIAASRGVASLHRDDCLSVTGLRRVGPQRRGGHHSTASHA